MRRALLAPALLALAGATLACPGQRRQGAPPAASTRPTAPGNRLNVLLITIDTLRADHLGLYGYRRATSPRLDAFARRAAVFEEAYTYWPKTRGSFVALLTGRLASQTGYGTSHPLLLDFNPTLAGVLKDAGYRTLAVVDNPNVSASLGYAKGFDVYRETWDPKLGLATETERARAITAEGVRQLREARPEQPFLLWLHYVSPHAPYEPPPPYDTAFLDAESRRGPVLHAVNGYHGGVARQWAREGKPLGWYVARYDGEIAATDAEVGQVLDALAASPAAERTLVVVTSDHGESLGEHDYYFDHGEDLFDPCLRIPLLVAGPGVKAGLRTSVLASTLDVVPTVLDALKVSYPPDLAGESLLPATRGDERPLRTRLQGQNDRKLLGAWGRRYKIVAVPRGDGAGYALYDRERDPGETREVSSVEPERLRAERRELELFRERIDGLMVRTRRLLEGNTQSPQLDPPACERLKALGYVVAGCAP